MYAQFSNRPFGPRMSFGTLFFALIAVTTSGHVAYRYLATHGSDGKIVAVRPYCELVTCNLGKCNQRQRMTCIDIPGTLQSNQNVRRFQEGRVEFVGGDGQIRGAWAEFSKFPRGTVRIGEVVNIHYIDGFGEEPEITGRPNLFLSIVGIAALFFFLSIGARIHHAKWAGR